MLPFLGSVLLLLLLVLAALYLATQAKLPLPKLGGHRSPEEEAGYPRRTLRSGTSARMSSWSGNHQTLDSWCRCGAVQASQEPPQLILAIEVYPTGSFALRMVVYPLLTPERSHERTNGRGTGDTR